MFDLQVRILVPMPILQMVSNVNNSMDLPYCLNMFAEFVEQAQKNFEAIPDVHSLPPKGEFKGRNVVYARIVFKNVKDAEEFGRMIKEQFF